MKFLLKIFFISFLILSCTEKKEPSTYKVKYNFNKPTRIYELPTILTEISGLEVLNDSLVVCVQDEDGLLFIYNLQDEKISDTVRFAENGDYEGVAVSGKDAFVVKSNGTIYSCLDFQTQGPIEEYSAGIKNKQEAEGLCFDNTKNRLLITPKKGKDSGAKDILSFDLNKKLMDQEPAFKLNLNEIEDFLVNNKFDEKSLDLKKIISQKDIFQPSGIAIHPLTQEIYILSNQNKLLVILNNEGTLQYVRHFNNPEMIQPEGITFTSNGDLYLSNEGKNGNANIILFKYDKNI